MQQLRPDYGTIPQGQQLVTGLAALQVVRSAAFVLTLLQLADLTSV
jgi:hypothetical protein